MPDHKLKAVEGEGKSTLSPAEMKSILQADRLAREQRAAARIKQVLEEERCVMNPVMVLAGNNVSGRIEVTGVD
jgi:hypothetical protein